MTLRGGVRTVLVNEPVGGMDLGRYKKVVVGVHGNAKLTWDDVKVIRAMKGSYSATYTAKYWAVGKQTVLDIWQGKTWRER